MIINPMFLTDFYKVFHYEQYPKGTELVFSNFTPRKSMMSGVNHSVFFGLRIFLENLNDHFYGFFNSPTRKRYIDEYKDFMKKTTGIERDWANIEQLQKLRYLPIAIHALPEGSVVPCGVPALVIYNTKPEFYWVTNFLETYMSSMLWGSCTSATIAREYRIILDQYAEETSDIPEFVNYQGHDFSFRGMYGAEAATISGMAHLQYFNGTDTIPAIVGMHKRYGEFIGTSVPATEHSVMSAGGFDTEFETYERLITETYPSGIISIVSDTWDLWKVVDAYLPKLKDKIMARDGKVVIRPDSGDPVDIICGTNIAHPYTEKRPTSEMKGLIESLWDIFGGTINSKGYKQLDPHIGAIYGDSITIDRCKTICARLKEKGFASTNIVFGIGSYTYQYNTRDTLGWAMKATYCEINGIGRAITKNPKTDNGTKKSHSGILKVVDTLEGYKCLQDQTWDSFFQHDNALKLAYVNGVIEK